VIYFLAKGILKIIDACESSCPNLFQKALSLCSFPFNIFERFLVKLIETLELLENKTNLIVVVFVFVLASIFLIGFEFLLINLLH
jgi:hypothetical protein